MTHELKKIIKAYKRFKKTRTHCVLATVVALDGSSYRRPGVRMLISQSGQMVGAVSGGCVEKEIVRQARSVFGSGIPRIMTYDGRYRLGCEGVLYILIEPFDPNNELLSHLDRAISSRENFHLLSSYLKKDGQNAHLGTFLQVGNSIFPFQEKNTIASGLEIFEQRMQPCFQLIIIGAEHDAVQLCSFASLTGWEVTIVASASEEKNISNFSGAKSFISMEPEMLVLEHVDDRTAIVLMTHSYVRDLKYLLALKDTRPKYLGLLGPKDRREKLLSEFLEYCPEIEDDFFDALHGPTGLNIGAETAQEIAISIISEILSVARESNPIKLKDKAGRIHS